MALTTHTVTLRTEYPGGDPLDGTWSTSVYAFPPLVKDLDGHVVIAGKDPEPTIEGTGELVLTLEATDQVGLDPPDFRWEISFLSRDRATRLGPYVFDLTEDRTLDDIANSTGIPLTSAILDQVIAARDITTEARDDAVAAAAVATAPTAGVVDALITDPGSGTHGVLTGVVTGMVDPLADAAVDQALEDGAVVSSNDVRIMTVSETSPVTPAADEIWVPTTDWLEGHDHPEYAPVLNKKSAANIYYHPHGTSPPTTDNLGAFAGALFQRVNLALFYWDEISTVFQSFSAEITTAGTGVVRFGIAPHDYTTGLPGNLSAQLGTIDATSATVQTITTAFTLAQGWHWLAWCWQGTNTTGPVIRARTVERPWAMPGPTALSLSTRLAGSFYPTGATGTAAGAFVTGTPLASVGALNNNDRNFPSVALRRAA